MQKLNTLVKEESAIEGNEDPEQSEREVLLKLLTDGSILMIDFCKTFKIDKDYIEG